MIELEHVSAGYDGRPVLRDISCSIPDGAVTAILGRNGAGKSTLLKTMTGLLPALEGSIKIDSDILSSMNPAGRARKCAYVKQGGDIPDMRVGQLVLHGRFPYVPWPRSYQKQDYDIARKAMESMRILSLENRMMPNISGGERQKAYLAMALCQQTPCIFFDEPASYMDLPSQLELAKTMDDLARQGKAVVVVEHDLIHALEHAHQILLVDQGHLVFCGTADELVHSGWIENVFHVSIQFVQVNGCKRAVACPLIS